jgi:hypothetical protein
MIDRTDSEFFVFGGAAAGQSISGGRRRCQPPDASDCCDVGRGASQTQAQRGSYTTSKHSSHADKALVMRAAGLKRGNTIAMSDWFAIRCLLSRFTRVVAPASDIRLEAACPIGRGTGLLG